MLPRPSFVARAVFMGLALGALGFAQEDEKAASQKRETLKDDAAGFWIYDDLQQGFARARSSGKPLLVSIRCVP